METTEKIVESYVRFIRKWATIPNIKCDGQNEIDLLAIDVNTGERYHIEVSVSISSGFSKLTAKEFDAELAKVRVHQAQQRTTVGHFVTKKFGAAGVQARLVEHGFHPDNHRQIIVAWDATPEAIVLAEANRIIIWKFPDLVAEMVAAIRHGTTYFTDDTLRTLHLYSLAEAKR